jgi:sec-independent protein translocase protein TatB
MDMDFFGVGPLEILFILLIAFVVFGPKRLFDISRNAGKAMHDFSKSASGFTAKIEKEMQSSSRFPENPDRRENKGNE